MPLVDSSAHKLTTLFGNALLPHLFAQQVAIKHVKVVFDALELIGVCLIERQGHRVTEALLPGRQRVSGWHDRGSVQGGGRVEGGRRTIVGWSDYGSGSSSGSRSRRISVAI